MSLLMKILKIVVMLGGGVFIVGYLFLQLVNSRNFQIFGESVNKVTTDKKIVALTFDDGPTDSTAEVLQIINDLNIAATFFVIGTQIEKYPELTREIVNSGHELGNHSYSHQRMIFKSYSLIKQEIEKTDQLIRAAGYQGTIHFRPPYFKKFIILPWYLEQTGRTTVLADVTPESEADIAASTEKIAEYTIASTRPGSILLLHPHHEQALSRPALVKIISELKQEGYQFVTISQLLGDTESH